MEDLGADIVKGVRRVKARWPAPDCVGQFDADTVLIEHELADEVMLLVFPVLLGVGKRLFADGTAPRELALVSTKAVSSASSSALTNRTGHCGQARSANKACGAAQE